MKLITLTVAICGGLVAGATASAPIPDRVSSVPSTKVLLDNDCVRVQYHDVAVGQTVPMHSHPAYVVYTLKPFKARITLADGSQRISEHQAGEAYWNEPIAHSVENLGSSDIHNLIVELKPAASCHLKK